MWNGMVLYNPVTGPDVPPDIGIAQEILPTYRPSAQAHPHENRNEKEVGQRRNRHSRPRVLKEIVDPDSALAWKRLSSLDGLGRRHVLSYSPDVTWYFRAAMESQLPDWPTVRLSARIASPACSTPSILRP